MRFASIIRLRFRSLFWRPEVDSELDEELEYHLERQIEKNVAAGMSHEDARVETLRSIAGIKQSKEECRCSEILSRPGLSRRQKGKC